MSWYDQVKHFFDMEAMPEDAFVRELRDYLLEKSGLGYDRITCRRTVQDVCAMDEDLRQFVMAYVRTGNVRGEELSCGSWFTMEEFLEKTGWDPVAAALLFQHYRTDPAAALRGLLRHDAVEGAPDTQV